MALFPSWGFKVETLSPLNPQPAQERKLRKGLAELQEAHAQQMAAVLDRYTALRAAVDQHHRQLEQVRPALSLLISPAGLSVRPKLAGRCAILLVVCLWKLYQEPAETCACHDTTCG